MLRSGRGWWPPLPYGQPDRKISAFFLTTSLSSFLALCTFIIRPSWSNACYKLPQHIRKMPLWYYHILFAIDLRTGLPLFGGVSYHTSLYFSNFEPCIFCSSLLYTGNSTCRVQNSNLHVECGSVYVTPAYYGNISTRWNVSSVWYSMAWGGWVNCVLCIVYNAICVVCNVW